MVSYENIWVLYLLEFSYITYGPIIAFNIRILLWFTQLNIFNTNTVLSSPAHKFGTDKFGTIIASDH